VDACETNDNLLMACQRCQKTDGTYTSCFCDLNLGCSIINNIDGVLVCDDGVATHHCTMGADEHMDKATAGLLAVPSGAQAFDDDYDDDLAAESHTFIDFEDTGFNFNLKASAESATLTSKVSMRGSEVEEQPASGKVAAGIAATGAMLVVLAVVVVAHARRSKVRRLAGISEVEGTATALQAGQSSEQLGVQITESSVGAPALPGQGQAAPTFI
jgi:hypothetical protein